MKPLAVLLIAYLAAATLCAEEADSVPLRKRTSALPIAVIDLRSTFYRVVRIHEKSGNIQHRASKNPSDLLEFFQRRQRTDALILRGILAEIEGYSEENDIALVIRRDGRDPFPQMTCGCKDHRFPETVRSIVFHNPDIDITDAIVVRLRERFASGGGQQRTATEFGIHAESP